MKDRIKHGDILFFHTKCDPFFDIHRDTDILMQFKTKQQQLNDFQLATQGLFFQIQILKHDLNK